MPPIDDARLASWIKDLYQLSNARDPEIQRLIEYARIFQDVEQYIEQHAKNHLQQENITFNDLQAIKRGIALMLNFIKIDNMWEEDAAARLDILQADLERSNSQFVNNDYSVYQELLAEFIEFMETNTPANRARLNKELIAKVSEIYPKSVKKLESFLIGSDKVHEYFLAKAHYFLAKLNHAEVLGEKRLRQIEEFSEEPNKQDKLREKFEQAAQKVMQALTVFKEQLKESFYGGLEKTVQAFSLMFAYKDGMQEPIKRPLIDLRPWDLIKSYSEDGGSSPKRSGPAHKNEFLDHAISQFMAYFKFFEKCQKFSDEFAELKLSQDADLAAAYLSYYNLLVRNFCHNLEIGLYDEQKEQLKEIMDRYSKADDPQHKPDYVSPKRLQVLSQIIDFFAKNVNKEELKDLNVKIFTQHKRNKSTVDLEPLSKVVNLFDSACNMLIAFGKAISEARDKPEKRDALFNDYNNAYNQFREQIMELSSLKHGVESILMTAMAGPANLKLPSIESLGKKKNLF